MSLPSIQLMNALSLKTCVIIASRDSVRDRMPKAFIDMPT